MAGFLDRCQTEAMRMGVDGWEAAASAGAREGAVTNEHAAAESANEAEERG